MSNCPCDEDRFGYEPTTFQAAMIVKMAEKELSVERLSDVAEIPEQWLRAYLNGVGLKQMPAWHAKQISDALGWSVENMCEFIFKKEGKDAGRGLAQD